MEIYAFGSIVRGEIDRFSDIDLLILKDYEEQLNELDKDKYSIYTFHRISELWKEGNPFAWHLFVESKCIYTPQPDSFIQSLGRPNQYNNLEKDLMKFFKLFKDSRDSVSKDQYAIDFDLSMIFLSIRNFASCFALGHLSKYEFSRDSALHIGKYSVNIDKNVYNDLKQARLLATRGIGKTISKKRLEETVSEFPKIEKWFNSLLTPTKI